MAMFKGFKPQGLQKIANSMGYTGSLEGFSSYLQQNPDKQNMMNLDESFTFCSSDQHHSEQMRYSTCTPLGIKTERLPMQRKQDKTRTKQKDGNTSG